jgi:SPP1 family predicted phage head-tail adaptor
MRAGQLRERFTVQRPTVSVGDDGAPDTLQSSTGPVHGELKALTGRETFLANQNYAEATHQIRVRWIAGVTSDLAPRDRLTLGPRVFDIQAVLDMDGRRRELTVLARDAV